uniref:HAUS augmin-like complex, subunit 7 n=1 Tax=Sinocyclocheilus anshuiensis TaxID=1608454 RepID=A0A671MK92_9TELE
MLYMNTVYVASLNIVSNTVTRWSLGCPLVDGLYLREPDSVQELLCSPSLHRTDILKWICASICPSLKEKFSTIKSTQNEDLVQ